MSGAGPQSESIDVTELMQRPAALVERYMKEYLQRMPFPGNLIEAMDYSLLGPGKRLRPVLVIHACEAVGGAPEAGLPAAAALEMIHCFSLIHDDLPAMDDDDLRRGRPTLHKKTNEAMAILAGDALMGLAFQLLTNEVTPAERATLMIRELADGTNAMIAGQVYDTLPDFDEDVEPATRLKTIHSHKTGALIRASVRMGALSAGADDAQLAALTAYGEAIGLMFQVVDDLIDVTQTTEHLGKTAGKDADQDKLTYPAVYGIEKTREQVETLRVESLAPLEGLGQSAQPLRDLAEYLAVRTR
jgi:geranylgeranyl diphosphate synthase type II